VFCSITGFGSGEGAALPGYDLLVQAVGGLMSITGPVEGEPTKVGVALVDVLTGLHAVVGIQAALENRHRTGRGQRVDVNLLSTLLASLVNQSTGTLATGEVPPRLGNAHPSIAPYESFRASDGSLIIAVGNDRQFTALCRVLGDPVGTGSGNGLSDDARFATNSGRVSHRAELVRAIEFRLAANTVAHWVDALTAAGVPAGPVNSIRDALDLAESLGLDPVVTIGAGDRQQRLMANPIGLSDTPPTYRAAPPDLGEHGGATWLGDASNG
ncbi:MAG TPA: CaiB/BaiF CoA-transferase family protein, partial [Terrimesophilobacter sp.]|nr:CaiB/BaiF CoA-transferase family protein [Terrimesophilobacter sp.]